jgi:phage terminase large subunit-like protein
LAKRYRIDKKKAQRVINFIERLCRLSKGEYAGKLIKLRPWQKKIIRELFGTVKADGTRRFRRAYISLARKNAKSSLMAAIALYMLFADGEIGGEVVIAANSVKQAGVIYAIAAEMVRQEPVLAERSKVVDFSRRIVDLETNSVLQVVSSEADLQLGADISFLVFDEINFAKSRELYDNLTSASGSRKQPLRIFISTAGKNIAGVGYSLYKLAKAVERKPEIDPGLYSCIFEVPKEADWANEKNWFKSNPALGDFLSLDEVRDQFNEAKNVPARQASFKMFVCNQWTEAADAWIPIEKWEQCRSEAPLEEILEQLRGKPCHVGIDLSSKIDMAAVDLIFPLEGKKYFLWPLFWIPDFDLRGRELRDSIPVGSWVETGSVQTVPGEIIRTEFIRTKLNDLKAQFPIVSVGYDPWNAVEFVQDLTEDGFECFPIRQGHQSLSDATKEWEALILSHRLIHAGNPCMDWQMSHVVTRPDANSNIVVDKKKSVHRIDGVAAGIMALDRCLREPAKPAPKKAKSLRVHVLG